MTERRRSGNGKAAGERRRNGTSVRPGGIVVAIFNSGLEVWLYDDANREAIRAPVASDTGSGGMPPGFEERTRQGLVVGYGLRQDDELRIEVHVGPPLTVQELDVARWLEAQTAILRVPSGKLCVESNDCSRIGPEEPTDAGAVVEVPPGDYRLTLYRVDHEALDRERLTWQGPQEVIVLTPGGSPEDAATELLPFLPRRDTTWVGRYRLNGRSAEALVWFGDYWDTFVVNLDSAATATLGLAPGSYLRTQVPAAGITLVTVLGEDWRTAMRLPPPSGVELDEYGYGALSPMGDWNGAEALFCRRERTKTRVEDEHQNLWLPAVVEVLEAEPVERTAESSWGAMELRTMSWFDPGFLTIVLSDLLPGAGDLDELELSQALDMSDAELATIGLQPQGDVRWTLTHRFDTTEWGCRLYTGLADRFGVILATEACFELVLVSELADGTWIATGLADQLENMIRSIAGVSPTTGPRVRVNNLDDSIPAIADVHDTALRDAKKAVAPAPADLEAAVATLRRFLAAALGREP